MQNTAVLENLYDDWTRENIYPSYTSEEYFRALKICKALNIPGKTVLDVGCGPGFISRRMKEMGHTIHGLDLSSEAIKEALRLGNIDHGVAGDVTRTDFEAQQFDVVVFWGILMLLLDVRPALKEAHRILKPGGSFLVGAPHARNPYKKFHFPRPKILDIWIDGKPNVPRRALTEAILQEEGNTWFRWETPEFYNMFTTHPDWKINQAHRIARLLFGSIRKITQAPWTGNFMALAGTKV